MPRALADLDRLLERGLTTTATRWPDIEAAYGWVHRAAEVLANHDEQQSAAVQAEYAELVANLQDDPAAWGKLTAARTHFLKVTASYQPGLFHCYDHAGLPRTNNDLEHVFGAARYHQRRATGRKQGGPALVVRGAVRVVTAVALRTQTLSAAELVPSDLGRWRALRASLAMRQEARRAQRRFRRRPGDQLAALEAALLKLSLPA